MEQKVGAAHMPANGIDRRNYQMDNLKCLLIFSVVFGHMLELFMGKNSPERVLYLVIYSFHMPLFAFVSGVFARYNPVKIKNNMIYPYLIFQTLYLLFSNQILEKDADVQYTTPYWLLWYLFAIIVWNLVLPLVQVEGMKKKLFMLLAAAAASVFIGFDDKAGYFLSASRIVEFFPYFLLGVYYREIKRTAGRRMGKKEKMDSERRGNPCPGYNSGGLYLADRTKCGGHQVRVVLWIRFLRKRKLWLAVPDFEYRCRPSLACLFPPVRTGGENPVSFLYRSEYHAGISSAWVRYQAVKQR